MTPCPKQPRISWPEYLEWQKDQRCAGCGAFPYGEHKSIPAHQRILGGGGTSYKNDDTKALPLCHECHDKEHHGSKKFWKSVGKDPLEECFKHIERFLRSKQC